MGNDNERRRGYSACECIHLIGASKDLATVTITSVPNTWGKGNMSVSWQAGTASHMAMSSPRIYRKQRVRIAIDTLQIH